MLRFLFFSTIVYSPSNFIIVVLNTVGITTLLCTLAHTKKLQPLFFFVSGGTFTSDEICKLNGLCPYVNIKVVHIANS